MNLYSSTVDNYPEVFIIMDPSPIFIQKPSRHQELTGPSAGLKENGQSF
jgi:hypothetical protein